MVVSPSLKENSTQSIPTTQKAQSSAMTFEDSDRWYEFILCICAHSDQIRSDQSLSRVRLFVTPWNVTHQAPLSMGFSRQEYWSGLPFPPPGDLPNPGIKPASLNVFCIRFFTSSATWAAQYEFKPMLTCGTMPCSPNPVVCVPVALQG